MVLLLLLLLLLVLLLLLLLLLTVMGSFKVKETLALVFCFPSIHIIPTIKLVIIIMLVSGGTLYQLYCHAS